MEDENKRRRISFSLSKLECGLQETNSREIRSHLPFSANWNKRDKDWKKQEFILKLQRFRCSCRRRCQSSLFLRGCLHALGEVADPSTGKILHRMRLIEVKTIRTCLHGRRKILKKHQGDPRLRNNFSLGLPYAEISVRDYSLNNVPLF